MPANASVLIGGLVVSAGADELFGTPDGVLNVGVKGGPGCDVVVNDGVVTGGTDFGTADVVTADVGIGRDGGDTSDTAFGSPADTVDVGTDIVVDRGNIDPEELDPFPDMIFSDYTPMKNFCKGGYMVKAIYHGEHSKLGNHPTSFRSCCIFKQTIPIIARSPNTTVVVITSCRKTRRKGSPSSS